MAKATKSANKLKLCDSCGVMRPIAEFVPDESSRDGLGTTCKYCTKEEVILSEKREMDERLQRFEEQSLAVLEAITLAPRHEAAKSPHLANLLEDVVEVFGGTVGYARHLYALYLGAKPGSTVRMRCLEVIERFTKEASAQGYVERPLSTMTDDEIDKLVEEQRARLMKDLRVVDGHTIAMRESATG